MMKKLVMGLIVVGGALAVRMSTRADRVVGFEVPEPQDEYVRSEALGEHAKREIPVEVEQDVLFNGILDAPEYAAAVKRYHEFIDQLNDLGVTPLMAAVKVARIQHVKILLAEGANPNIRSNDALKWSDMPIDKGGNTAGHFALYYGNNPVVEDIVAGLVGIEADFGIRNNAGDQPINYVGEIQSNEVRIRLITLLMENEVDIFAQGYKGDTILHQAVDRNDIALIELLYDLIGREIIKYTVKNDDGLTPLEVARHNLNTDVEEVLLSIEAEVQAQERGQEGVELVG